MTDTDDSFEDEKTIAVRADADDVEDTISTADSAAAVVADEDVDEDEHTIVVDRSAADAGDEDPEQDDDEHTIVVKRGAPGDDENDDEHTIVVDREKASPADDSDDTITVTRSRFSPPSAAADDDTIVVDRDAKGPRLTRPEGAVRRRGIKPPPVPEGFAPLATEGLGPWGIEEYSARSIVAPPKTVEVDADATPPREPDPSLSSVRRHSRRVARAALIAFVISCTVLAAGIVALVLWLIP